MEDEESMQVERRRGRTVQPQQVVEVLNPGCGWNIRNV